MHHAVTVGMITCRLIGIPGIYLTCINKQATSMLLILQMASPIVTLSSETVILGIRWSSQSQKGSNVFHVEFDVAQSAKDLHQAISKELQCPLTGGTELYVLDNPISINDHLALLAINPTNDPQTHNLTIIPSGVKSLSSYTGTLLNPCPGFIQLILHDIDGKYIFATHPDTHLVGAESESSV